MAVLVAAVALCAASTAYACVNVKGNATVTGATTASNQMTGDGAHGYCAGGTPVTAASGNAGTTVSATFSAATTCLDPLTGKNQLSGGGYEVRFRNGPSYAGSDGSGWNQVPASDCFLPPVGGTNYSIGTNLTIDSTGSGSGSWSLPAVLAPNGPNDASIFCVAKKVPGTNAGSGANDGFLAPFRVLAI